MTRRRGLIAAGVATVLLLLAMSPAEERMQDNGPGMVPFELTGGQDRADEILAEWGEEGQEAAREQLWIDYAFLLVYGAFLTLAAAATRDLARERGWRRLGAIGGVAVYFGALCAAFDALENTCLLLTLEGSGAAFPLLATIFAAFKFGLSGGGDRLHRRRPDDAAARPHNSSGFLVQSTPRGPPDGARPRLTLWSRCEFPSRVDPHT